MPPSSTNVIEDDDTSSSAISEFDLGSNRFTHSGGGDDDASSDSTPPQSRLEHLSALSGAAELSDDSNEDNDDDWDVALENEDDIDDLLTEDGWSAYTPSPGKSSPPPPPTAPPSPTKEVVFGTTADESIVSSAGEAIDPEVEVKKDTPKDEGKGKRKIGLGAMAEFEEREAKRMVLGELSRLFTTQEREAESGMYVL